MQKFILNFQHTLTFEIEYAKVVGVEPTIPDSGVFPQVE